MVIIKYHENNHSHKDMICYGGYCGSADVPFFLSCDQNGSVPYPGCNHHIFYNGLHAEAGYSKLCVPHHQKNRDSVINYISSAAGNWG